MAAEGAIIQNERALEPQPRQQSGLPEAKSSGLSSAVTAGIVGLILQAGSDTEAQVRQARAADKARTTNNAEGGNGGGQDDGQQGRPIVETRQPSAYGQSVLSGDVSDLLGINAVATHVAMLANSAEAAPVAITPGAARTVGMPVVQTHHQGENLNQTQSMQS